MENKEIIIGNCKYCNKKITNKNIPSIEIQKEKETYLLCQYYCYEIYPKIQKLEQNLIKEIDWIRRRNTDETYWEQMYFDLTDLEDKVKNGDFR